MTPKEKAQELLNKFRLSAVFTDTYVKALALIAVDELINAHNGMKDFLFSEIGYLITTPEYWQEVKNEIEKL